ncbi:MAG: hypothetical protein JNK34_05230 [Tabrizicola sp.]|nr:hypothetical protein [Tabrizicola sp.]
MIHPAGDDLAHLWVVGRDGETPERPVDPPPPLVAVEKPVHLGGKIRPVAVQHVRLDEVLELKVTWSFPQPTGVGGKAFTAKGSAQNRKGHQSASRVGFSGMLRSAGNKSVHVP